jgi:hypothetical protein
VSNLFEQASNKKARHPTIIIPKHQRNMETLHSSGELVLEEASRDSCRQGKCACSALTYDGNKMAIGYAIVRTGRNA